MPSAAGLGPTARRRRVSRRIAGRQLGALPRGWRKASTLRRRVCSDGARPFSAVADSLKCHAPADPRIRFARLRPRGPAGSRRPDAGRRRQGRSDRPQRHGQEQSAAHRRRRGQRRRRRGPALRPSCGSPMSRRSRSSLPAILSSRRPPRVSGEAQRLLGRIRARRARAGDASRPAADRCASKQLGHQLESGDGWRIKSRVEMVLSRLRSAAARARGASCPADRRSAQRWRAHWWSSPS